VGRVELGLHALLDQPSSSIQLRLKCVTRSGKTVFSKGRTCSSHAIFDAIMAGTPFTAAA